MLIQVSLRLPEDLHAAVIEAARKEGRSINNFANVALRDAVRAAAGMRPTVTDKCLGTKDVPDET